MADYCRISVKYQLTLDSGCSQDPSRTWFADNGFIHVKDLKTKQPRRKKRLGDLWDECPEEAKGRNTVTIEAEYDIKWRAVLEVTLPHSHAPPLSIKVSPPNWKR